MVKVWVLMMYLTTWNTYGGAGGPVVIDNIASKAECERLMSYVYQNLSKVDTRSAVCVEVWKNRQ